MEEAKVYFANFLPLLFSTIILRVSLNSHA